MFRIGKQAYSRGRLQDATQPTAGLSLKTSERYLDTITTVKLMNSTNKS